MLRATPDAITAERRATVRRYVAGPVPLLNITNREVARILNVSRHTARRFMESWCRTASWQIRSTLVDGLDMNKNHAMKFSRTWYQVTPLAALRWAGQ